MKPVFRTFLLSLLMFTLCLILPSAVSAQTGTIIIDKVTLPTTGSADQFNIYLEGTSTAGEKVERQANGITDAAPPASFVVPTGTYRIFETELPKGWKAASDSYCTSSILFTDIRRLDSFPLRNDKILTCKIRNWHYGFITVKLALDSAPTDTDRFYFSFINSRNYSTSIPSLPIAGSPDPYVYTYDIGPETYSIRASSGNSDWTLDAANVVCTSDIPGKTLAYTSFKLEGSESVTCTFPFRKNPTLYLQVLTLPPNDRTVFYFDRTISGVESDRFAINVASGVTVHKFTPDVQVSFSPVIPEDWDLYQTECLSSIPGKAIKLSNFTAEAREEIHCTYKYAKLLPVYLDKYWSCDFGTYPKPPITVQLMRKVKGSEDVPIPVPGTEPITLDGTTDEGCVD